MIRKVRHARELLPDPSPDEIRQRAEAIRQGWTETERNRRANLKPTAWMPPILTADQVPELNETDTGSAA